MSGLMCSFLCTELKKSKMYWVYSCHKFGPTPAINYSVFSWKRQTLLCFCCFCESNFPFLVLKLLFIVENFSKCRQTTLQRHPILTVWCIPFHPSRHIYEYVCLFVSNFTRINVYNSFIEMGSLCVGCFSVLFKIGLLD